MRVVLVNELGMVDAMQSTLDTYRFDARVRVAFGVSGSPNAVPSDDVLICTTPDPRGEFMAHKVLQRLPGAVRLDAQFFHPKHFVKRDLYEFWVAAYQVDRDVRDRFRSRGWPVGPLELSVLDLIAEYDPPVVLDVDLIDGDGSASRVRGVLEESHANQLHRGKTMRVVQLGVEQPLGMHPPSPACAHDLLDRCEPGRLESDLKDLYCRGKLSWYVASGPLYTRKMAHWDLYDPRRREYAKPDSSILSWIESRYKLSLHSPAMGRRREVTLNAEGYSFRFESHRVDFPGFLEYDHSGVIVNTLDVEVGDELRVGGATAVGLTRGLSSLLDWICDHGITFYDAKRTVDRLARAYFIQDRNGLVGLSQSGRLLREYLHSCTEVYDWCRSYGGWLSGVADGMMDPEVLSRSVGFVVKEKVLVKFEEGEDQHRCHLCESPMRFQTERAFSRYYCIVETCAGWRDEEGFRVDYRGSGFAALPRRLQSAMPAQRFVSGHGVWQRVEESLMNPFLCDPIVDGGAVRIMRDYGWGLSAVPLSSRVVEFYPSEVQDIVWVKAYLKVRDGRVDIAECVLEYVNEFEAEEVGIAASLWLNGVSVDDGHYGDEKMSRHLKIFLRQLRNDQSRGDNREAG